MIEKVQGEEFVESITPLTGNVSYGNDREASHMLSESFGRGLSQLHGRPKDVPSTEVSAFTGQPSLRLPKGIAQKYDFFPTVMDSGTKKLSKKELESEIERVKAKRLELKAARYEAWEQLIARQDDAKKKLALCAQKEKAAIEKKQENQRIREDRNTYFKSETEARKAVLDATTKECESLRATLHKKKEEMESIAPSHDMKKTEMEEYFKDTTAKMQKRNAEIIEMTKKAFDEGQILVQIESDIQFLQDVLKDLKKRNATFNKTR